MNVEQLIKSRNWRLMGKWKEPILLANLVTSTIVNGKMVGVIPSVPSVYLNVDWRQYPPEEDFRSGVEIAKGLFQSDISRVISHFSDWIRSSVKRLNDITITELTPQVASGYLHALSYHARQWYEIMLADAALTELYPTSLPDRFTLGRDTYTPQTLLAKVALPKKLFPMIEEHNDLLEMAILLKSKGNITARLAKHVEKYSWMNSLCWWGDPFTTEYYQGEVEKLTHDEPAHKLKERQDERRQRYAFAERLLELVHTEYPIAWSYIDAIRELTDLKEENWDVVAYAGVRNRASLHALAAKYFLSYNQLNMLSPTEFVSVIKGELEPNVAELNNRLHHFAIVTSQNDNVIIAGTRAVTLSNLLQGEVKQSEVLYGTVIWQGKATGRVHVINSPDEINKMKAGEILVCPMTDPDYMPAIKLAKAIVTDQGGVLCHAAIVARELGVPCIVGTNHASRILRDGDEVEVDANEGKVSVLKRV